VAEAPSSEPTAKNYSLREELAQHRGILWWFCGRFEQSDTGESCGVEMAEGEELRSNLLRVNQRAWRYNSVRQGTSLLSLADGSDLSRLFGGTVLIQPPRSRYAGCRLCRTDQDRFPPRDPHPGVEDALHTVALRDAE
jgi:hypothetical protein